MLIVHHIILWIKQTNDWLKISFSYEDLKKIFGRYGRIVDITLPLDYYTRDAKGYGFVEYEESRDAGKWRDWIDWKMSYEFIVEEALHALDRYRLLGRELEVEFARGDRKSKVLFNTFKKNLKWIFID